GPAAQNHGELAGLYFAEADVVASHRDGLDQSGLFKAEIRGKLMERVGGYCPEFLHSAWRVDTNKLQVHADVLVSSQAGGASAARIQGPHGNTFAGLPAGNAFPYGCYRP